MIRSSKRPPGLAAKVRAGIFLSALAATAGLSLLAGFNAQQAISCMVFAAVVLATLFFWQHRFAAAFVGIAALLAGRALTLQKLVEFSELNIILFLVGMMVAVGVLKEMGLFTWVIQSVLNIRRMNGPVFVLAVVLLSALMASVIGEITSIIFMCALIFQVCDTLKVRVTPFLLISVMATNIGSAGTIHGNLVGILLGYKAGFTFGDFLVWAFPVMLSALILVLGVLIWWYRHEIAVFTERLEARRMQGLGLGPLVRLPIRRALAILAGMLTLIALHNVIEQALGLETNSVLIVAPVFVSGILMIWRHERARHYIENEVEWCTLLYFMMLFVVAGALANTGVATIIAGGFLRAAGSNVSVLTPLVVALSAAGSALVNNVVFAAAFIPVIAELDATPLWWALLFGACFGGNITVMGSTANIVAIGMIEKRRRGRIRFVEWFKVGAATGLVSCAAAWGALTLLSPRMPRADVAPEHILEEPAPEPMAAPRVEKH